MPMQIGRIENLAPIDARRAGYLLRLDWLFVFVGLFFVSGELTRPLSGFADLGANLQNVQAPYFQLVGLCVYSWSILRLVTLPAPWPMTLPVILLLALNAMALLSAYWSVDPSLTLRRALALTGATSFALYLLAVTRDRDFTRVLIQFACAFVAINFLLMLLLPSIAFHMRSDLSFPEHAGKLRSLYFHKNDFARTMGVVFVTLALAHPRRFGGSLVWLLWVALAGLLLVLTSSANGLISALLAILLTFLAASLMRTGLGMIWIVLCCLAAALAILSFDLTALGQAFLAQFGRDLTLSSRTEIWRGVLLAIDQNPLMGGGYAAGWQAAAARLVTTAVWQDVGNAHNGYLQVAIELGLVGLGLLLGYLAAAFIAVLRCVQAAAQDTSRVMLGILAFIAVSNLAGSYYMLQNDLFWVLMIVVPHLAVYGSTSLRNA